MSKNHCCCHCFGGSGEKYFIKLSNGRTIYFCSYKCKKEWEKAKNLFLKERGKNG
jgi:YHS domain-containing protein